MIPITEFYVDVRGWTLDNIYRMAQATDTYLDVNREMLIAMEIIRK